LFGGYINAVVELVVDGQLYCLNVIYLPGGVFQWSRRSLEDTTVR